MDSLSIVMHRFTLIFLLLTAMLAIGCAERGSVDVYSHKGFSVEYPDSWKFKLDQDFSLKGDREVIFMLGEVSYVAFYFNDRLSFREFNTKFLEIDFLRDESSAAKLVSQTPFEVAGRSAVDSQVSEKFIGPLNTRILTIDVSQNAVPVFMVAVLAEEDGVSIQSDLKHVVSSVKIDKNVKDEL